MRQAGTSWLSPVLGAAVILALATSEHRARGESGPIDSRGVTAIEVVPPRAQLLGPDAVQQLAVDGLVGNDVRRDLTSGSAFQSANPAVATVDAAGTIVAQGDGSTSVSIRVGSFEATVPVDVKGFASPPPINFG